ncbi:MAG: cell division protein ZapD [Shewanella sp.]|nr:cell division protein ZapD [Shewanella sp.]
MTELVYEQPLNEKIRSYLRLEYLDKQLQSNLNHDHQHRCFYPLFSLCELSERCDYRNEVLKDIERHLLQLSKWQELDHVDHQQIDLYINALTQAREPLQKPDRFGMPGACCNFDLPQLHYWLAKPWEEKQQDYRSWIAHFEPLLTPITLLLQLTRSTAHYDNAVAHAGFYQGDSAQALALVRVKVDASHGCYPTISGHKNRFAIHFVQFEQQRHSDRSIDFLLATCA